MVPKANPPCTRHVFRCVLLLCALASCDRHTVAQASLAQARLNSIAKAKFAPALQQGAGLHLAYTHELTLQLPAGALAVHFAAARDRCLTPATHCILLSASISEERADLQVRLPHDQVAPFADALTHALPGEPGGQTRIVHQSTEATDLGRPVTDVAQRVAQLTEYLASLKSMAQRLTISVSDLVKIAGETAQAQTQIEQALAEQRDLAQRVDTEAMDIGFEPAAPAALPPPDPVAQILGRTTEILRQSTAEALEVAIEALPWVPFALIALLALALARRALFGRTRL